MVVEFLTVIHVNPYRELGADRDEIVEVVVDLMDLVSFHKSYVNLNEESLDAVRMYLDHGPSIKEFIVIMEYNDFKSLYNYYLASKGSKDINEIVRAKDFINKEWRE